MGDGSGRHPSSQRPVVGKSRACFCRWASFVGSQIAPACEGAPPPSLAQSSQRLYVASRVRVEVHSKRPSTLRNGATAKAADYFRCPQFAHFCVWSRYPDTPLMTWQRGYKSPAPIALAHHYAVTLQLSARARIPRLGLLALAAWLRGAQGRRRASFPWGRWASGLR